jgi:hypothetical protein
MGEPIYLLDANVFIEASRRYYAFDLAPKFWGSLSAHAQAGQILSIDRVKYELERGKDELATWAKGQFSHGFVSTDEEEINQVYADIMIWVNNQIQFTEPAKAKFANDADGWLIAYAKAKNCVLVTHEVFAADAKNKVKIPNVCKAFDVPYVDTFEMLRKLGVRFG